MIEQFDLWSFLHNPVKAAALAAALVLLAACVLLHVFRRKPAFSRLRVFSVYAQLAFVLSAAITFALATTCSYMVLPCQASGFLSLAAFAIPAAIVLVVFLGPRFFARIYAFYSGAREVKSGALKSRLLDLALRAGAGKCGLYVFDCAKPSAFSFSGGSGAVFLSVGMLDLLGKSELDAVMLHELAHVKSRSSTFKLSVAVLRALSPFSAASSFNGELCAEEENADSFAASIQGTGRFLRSAKKKLDSYCAQ
ncbi:MAG: M48 family metalloprotease [Candidatus Micrarchaeia archaeon]|jgi:Zn-dependent protease with chaperone function